MGRVVRRRAKQPIAVLQNEALNRRSRVSICSKSFQSFGGQFFQRIWNPSVGKTMMFNHKSKRRCANVRKKTKFSFQKFYTVAGKNLSESRNAIPDRSFSSRISSLCSARNFRLWRAESFTDCSNFPKVSAIKLSSSCQRDAASVQIAPNTAGVSPNGVSQARFLNCIASDFSTV